MKKYLLSFGILIFCTKLLAQNVGINGTGALPDASAMLDVSAPNKGMLVPRTSTTSRIAIVNPAKGLMLYDTTTSSFWFHDGSIWNEIPKGAVSGGSDNWAVKDTNIYKINKGNVGIGTNAPEDPLTIQTADLKRGFSHRGQNGKILTSFMGDTFVELVTGGNTDFDLGAGAIPHVIIKSNGNVGINYVHPTNQFQIGVLDSNYFYGNQFAMGDGRNGTAINQGNQLIWTSSTNMSILPKFSSGGGSLGIGTYEQNNNKLQIGSIGSTGYTGNDIAFGNGVNAGAIAQLSVMQVASTTDMNFLPRTGVGNLGINAPGAISNRLQIGNTGGFAGNDIAFGNAGQVTGIAQTANILQIATTTDVSFLPQYGTNHGRVGINTLTPLAPLDVAGFYSVNPLSSGYSYVYQNLFDGDHSLKSFIISPGPVPGISILASSNIYANEFDAFSDIRIKNLMGTSDAIKDLSSINAIKIRDYTMKDKLIYGNKHFKKVIAQELEKVYPDLVSKHTDFIPNVYQITDTVTKVTAGYLLHFHRDHHLGDTAKKLKVLLTETGSLQSFDIVSVPSSREIIINAPEINIPHVFVYGEQVNDFRTVDYEGLTTLNISATQEISRMVNTQATTISNQQKQIDVLSERLTALEKATRKSKNHLNKNNLLAAR